MKKRYATWNHFTLLEDNPNKCKCNYCGRQYQCHSRRDGITNMRNHILACLAYKTFREQQEGSQQNLTTEGGEGNASNMVLAKGWSQDACRRAVTKMIIMGELPLSFVDNKGFRHFCSVAIPQFVMPSRRTIGKDVMDLFLEEKTMLKSLICNNKQNDDAIVLVGQYMHVRCCAHILNLIVVSGLNELHGSVAAIRNVVKYVRSSTTRLHAFKQCAQQVKCPMERLFWIVLLEASKDPWVVAMANQMREKFDKYWESSGKINKMLIVASILDPRAKMDFAKHIFEIIFANDGWKVEEMTKAVKDLLNELYDAYSAMCSSSTPSMCSESVPSGSYGGTSYSPYFTTEVGLPEGPSGDGDDIFRVSRPFFGYAQKVNGSKYLILEKIARDVFAVLVSTVASESAFSTGRHVIDEYRSSLTPCMVEALICTENWLQAKLFANPVYNLQEDIKEQIFHMELQEVSADIGVMDI
ncbi:BED-type domain-containing protein [Citrus sinensis]|uniref:BED-type domain-containing protein n=1 Tax=Citrus sinensis TaxID=2711 RepID=A0ACB8KC62_CITSI|nr:BED-type domain-containing protein [Citrus sinensis]